MLSIAYTTTKDLGQLIQEMDTLVGCRWTLDFSGRMVRSFTVSGEQLTIGPLGHKSWRRYEHTIPVEASNLGLILPAIAGYCSKVTVTAGC